MAQLVAPERVAGLLAVNVSHETGKLRCRTQRRRGPWSSSPGPSFPSTPRGFHVVTFTLPMSDIVSYNVKGKAEKNVELLSEHLADWVREEDGKKIVFHTFSNTDWLCYGVILENLQRQDPSAVEKIKGSVIDSAPVAVPDSQVWALGFSAAIMKKNSVAMKGDVSNDTRSDVIVVESQNDIRPAATKAVLLSALEKFFDIVLNYPAINRYAADPHMQVSCAFSALWTISKFSKHFQYICF
ncbi:uncharacterized protein LOC123405571 [Hordeum vulgare subsp. vulgare]|uniref:uncharacterized protein LOC123405571 n=1 Tax=Hordeum vulgare subsp. vulgare TaxID=112509 RepID=UPI001D1A4327|nr:uncharacterized protein LOC123405571 [Hordeum vulgare subsp. vulgare]